MPPKRSWRTFNNLRSRLRCFTFVACTADVNPTWKGRRKEKRKKRRKKRDGWRRKHDRRKPFNTPRSRPRKRQRFRGPEATRGAQLEKPCADCVSMPRVDPPEITLTVRSICINNTAKPSSTLSLAFFDPTTRILERVARREESFIRTLTLPLPAAFHA